jgi:hypothetical protein
MRVMYERVAGIDVHKDMIKVGIRVPGHRAWTRNSEVLEYRTFYGVLLTMAADLRKRGVTHVVMEASGVYTEPVYYALAGQGFGAGRGDQPGACQSAERAQDGPVNRTPGRSRRSQGQP